jgi:platelet-activating factor acetylhydrolase
MLVWSLPLWSLAGTTVMSLLPTTTPWWVPGIGVPISVLALHQLATWRRPFYWQLIPATLGWGAALLSWKIAAGAMGIVGVVCNLVFPMPRLQRTHGPFGVGVVDYEVLPAAATSSDALPPTIGRMFYPIDSHRALGGRRSSTPYIAFDDQHGLTRKFMQCAAPAFLRKYLPSFILNHWAAMRVEAEYLAELATTTAVQQQLPVILFSHGLTASRETSTSLATSLTATSGAVVVLVEHTDRSCSLARFMDGTTLEYDASIMDLGSEPATPAYRDARRAQTDLRKADLDRTLELLTVLNARDDPSQLRGRIRLGGVKQHAQAEALLSSLRGRLAVENVAVGGHSFGGAAALCFAADHHAAVVEDSARRPAAKIGACFTLDPAVDWTPQRVWEAIGYDGVFNDSHRPSGRHDGEDPLEGGPLRDAPPLAEAIPNLTIWSEGWVRLRWYQRWATMFCRSAGAKSPAATLTIAGCGHQGLCDLAHTLPHWLNAGLKNTLGTPSAEVDRAVTASVLAFLRLSGVLPPAENVMEKDDLTAIPNTKGVIACVQRRDQN